jgi:transposase InsO family protein
MQRTTPTQRRAFYELHQQELTYPEIAERFGVSRECVRYWCRRQKAGHSSQSAYHRERRGLLSGFDDLVRYVLLRLRLAHPRWGPSRLRFHLRKRPSLRGLKLPSEASLGRYLHQWERFRRQKREKKQTERPNPPQRVQQRWQIDFKLGIALPRSARANLHTVRDPVGEAVIGAYLYLAPREVLPKHVPMEEVRATLRRCFAQWGYLPEEVQTDGESTLIGKPNDNFPSQFTLWLVGLGIQHLITRAGHPTDNAEVERCHRTLNDYALVGQEGIDLPALQNLLEQAVEELNDELPSQAKGCAGQPPVLAHPELLERLRPYQPERERLLFDLGRVDAYLAGFVWERKVDVNGVVYLVDRYSLGRKYARQGVKVRFDPADRNFVCFQTDAEERVTELRRWPARHLEVADITGWIECAWPQGLGPQQLRLALPDFEGVSC